MLFFCHSMLGISRLQHRWMRRRRANPSRMHGQAPSAAEEGQQHQFSSGPTVRATNTKGFQEDMIGWEDWPTQRGSDSCV